VTAARDTGYSASAEFYELVAARQAQSSGPALRAALAGVDAAAGPVLEIGAGTGRITEVIADALPDAEIVAAEPAAEMRAVLTSRAYADPALRRRVTVTPDSAQRIAAAGGDGPICAAVVFGVAGHLDTAERVALWRALAARLPAGGPIVVELMGVATPRVIPPVRLLRERVGEQVYEWWSSGEPCGEDVMRFDTTWKVFAAGSLVREVRESHRWHTLTATQLAAESGLAAERITQVDGQATAEITVLRRSPATVGYAPR
jgi:phospholipid N-methyltransferase